MSEGDKHSQESIEPLVPPSAVLGAVALAFQSLWETKDLGSLQTHIVIFPAVGSKKRVMSKLEILSLWADSERWLIELLFLLTEYKV